MSSIYLLNPFNETINAEGILEHNGNLAYSNDERLSFLSDSGGKEEYELIGTDLWQIHGNPFEKERSAGVLLDNKAHFPQFYPYSNSSAYPAAVSSSGSVSCTPRTSIHFLQDYILDPSSPTHCSKEEVVIHEQIEELSSTEKGDSLETFALGEKLLSESSTCSISSKTTTSSSSDSHSGCPTRPYHLMKTNMKLKLDQHFTLDQVIGSINLCLDTFSEYDFSYEPAAAMWKGKYIQGSKHCVIHIHLYCDVEENDVFFIEANRVEGDAKPFYDFYKEFRHALSHCQGGPFDNDENALISSAPAPFESSSWFSTCQVNANTSYHNHLELGSLPSCQLTPQQFLQSIDPVLNMTESPFFEIQLESAKMLYDISQHNHDHLRESFCQDKIIATLERMILKKNFAAVKEQAIIALASFAEVSGYEHKLVNSAVLPDLMCLVTNPPSNTPAYESAQMRRESARTLVTLTAYDAISVVKRLELGHIRLERWMEKVDDIRDSRLKALAVKIKEKFIKAQLILHKG